MKYPNTKDLSIKYMSIMQNRIAFERVEKLHIRKSFGS